MADTRERVLRVLRDLNFQLPPTLITDEPTRCIRYNLQWSPIIEGWLLWLAEVAAWRDAEDVKYTGIIQILNMLVGEDCAMPLDCQEVIDCMQNIIDGLQTQITDNTNNIATNTNNIATNTNNIATNTGDIADHETRITSIENVDIPQINLTLNNHEARIAALEAFQASGGTIKVSHHRHVVPSDFTANASSYTEFSGSLVNHEFSLPNALVICALACGNNGTTQESFFRVKVGGLASANERRLQGNAGDYDLLLSENYLSVPQGDQECVVEFFSTAGNTIFHGSQTVLWTIIEYGEQAIEPPISHNYLVDFDGGHAYTQGGTDTGQLSSGGNPDQCWLNQSAAFGDHIDIIADNISEAQIDSITTDAYVNGNGIVANLWNNNQFVATHEIQTVNAWVRLNWNAISPSSFPITNNPAHADGVRIFFTQNAGGGTTREMRMDNIAINTSE